MKIPFLTFAIYSLLILITTIEGKHGKGSGKESTIKEVSKKSPSPPPAPPPPPPPSLCQAVTANITYNIHRNKPCSNANPCFVVVNTTLNTSTSCLTWSPSSYWDGSHCMCRCELMGGVLDNKAMTCTFKSSRIIYTNSADPVFLAPIACGTWLGFRDSAWSGSWFASECLAILQNRWENKEPVVNPCDVDKYTTGCRFFDTKQRMVPLCRQSNSTECGVQIVCPSPNPCGLGPDIDSNLDNAFLSCDSCQTQTYLALNVSANETNCAAWTPYAFVLDGYCVSSCGRMDGKCTLGNGAIIPHCNTTRETKINEIIDISPDICSVPMPSDTFTGIRNGFCGMSRVPNSPCLVSTNCTNGALCFIMEGVSFNILPYESSINVPLCKGDPSIRCKIEYPCNEPFEEASFNCSDNKLPPILSEAIYAPMGVRSCKWFEIRDTITVVFWALSLICITSCLGRPDHALAGDPGGLMCLWFLLVLVCMALSCVWEFVLGIFGFVLLSICAVFIFRRFLSFPYEIMPVVS